MRHPGLSLIATLALLGNLSAAKPGPDVLVVADAVPDPGAPLRPTPDRPVYYILLGNLELDHGQPLAHMPRPDSKAMEAELIRLLAQQGFIKTQVGGPLPQAALVFSWGTASVDDFAETDLITGEISELAYNANRRMIRQLVGADRIRNVSLVEGEKIRDTYAQAEESYLPTNARIYITVVAFDFLALTRKQTSVLWRTHMSLHLTDHTLPDTFPIMLASAAPWFGRTTDKPVFIDDRVRQTSVTLGELEVIGEVRDSAPTRGK